MIANALDADNKFTASQVSRKLKQLGLYIPRQKRSQSSMHLSDGDLHDLSAEKKSDSDDETLLSLVNRYRYYFCLSSSAACFLLFRSLLVQLRFHPICAS